jgi:type VI secretion system protein ImpC
MPTDKQKEPASTVAGSTVETPSLLSEILTVTDEAGVEQNRVKDWLSTVVEQATKGLVTWDKNVTRTFDKALKALDEMMSKQLAAVLHDAKLQKLEGSWRGMHHLVFNTETSKTLKLKVFNVTKGELAKDLDKAVEFDQSLFWKKLYTHEYSQPGGEPYGAIIGDYEFTNHPEDVAMLRKISEVAAASFCPFISAASPQMFGFKDFTKLPKPRDLEKIFLASEYIEWNAFRDSEESRFVTLVMPKVLSRPPYGKANKSIEEFNFEEFELDKKGRQVEMPHDKFCWMNAAYVEGAILTNAFARTGWCTTIRGYENGGKVDGLPLYKYVSPDGDTKVKCPSEAEIDDTRSAELDKLGFLSLGWYRKTDFSVFFGAQTTQRPKFYGPKQPAANANAQISARLPYILCASRIAHYLKVIARDSIGSFMEKGDVQTWLNNWIADYIADDPSASADIRAKFPLRQARIDVEEVPGKPGSYRAVAYLLPWLQFEELTASLRMVANLPPKVGN